MPLDGDFVYPDPKTPAHLRDVLRTIRSRSDSTDAAIAALQAQDVVLAGRIDALEAITGPVSATFDATATLGQVMFVTGTGSVGLADASALATAAAVALVTTAATPGNTGAVLRRGRVVSPDWSAVVGTGSLTPGATYYLSTTAGRMSTTAPTARGQVVVPMGIALTASDFDLNIQSLVLL